MGCVVVCGEERGGIYFITFRKARPVALPAARLATLLTYLAFLDGVNVAVDCGGWRVLIAPDWHYTFCRLWLSEWYRWYQCRMSLPL